MLNVAVLETNEVISVRGFFNAECGCTGDFPVCPVVKTPHLK